MAGTMGTKRFRIRCVTKHGTSGETMNRTCRVTMHETSGITNHGTSAVTRHRIDCAVIF